MSQILATLLEADQPLFRLALERLEQASGHQGVDVRLGAEIIGKVHQKTRELGLDPKDTTSQELYQALLLLIKRHDEFLARHIGVKGATDVQAILPRIKALLDQLDIPRSAWVMKPSAAKRLLRSMPPRRIMKQLGYRSVESMLKREPIAELFGALRFAESPEWLERFTQKYKTLTPADFETRDVQILQLDGRKWGASAHAFVRQKRHNITHVKEFGIVLILPLPLSTMKGITIIVLPLLLHYLNEIRIFSAYFKLQQVQPHFGRIVAETILYDPGQHAIMAGHKLHWRVIGRHFGGQPRHMHPETFEPHVQPEDLYWRKAEETLFRLEPALHFWHDMDYVASQRGLRPVSFNLVDLAISYANDLPYGQQAVHHFRSSLWNQLLERYLGERALEVQVLKQLDYNQPVPEFTSLDLEESLL